MSHLDPDDKEYLYCLQSEFIDVSDYVLTTLPIARLKGDIKLTFSADKYDKFIDIIGLLQLDLLGFQNYYNHAGDYEKEESFENLQDLIDLFIRLLRVTIISDT